jgi:RimJ/RimL family protein N-acetyltransferase
MYLLEKEETARLYFRKIAASDFAQWLEFFKDPTSFAYWEGQLEAPEVECKKWFDRQAERYQNNEGGMNAIIEKDSGSLIGYGGLLVQRVDGARELEVAYSLLSSFRNKGYATEVAMKCRDFGFEQKFADSLISIISLTNTPSANVARKNGMHVDAQTEYKKNAVNIFRIRKSDWLQMK